MRESFDTETPFSCATSRTRNLSMEQSLYVCWVEYRLACIAIGSGGYLVI